MSESEAARPRYTCTDYREEMRLMGLKRLLEKQGISEAEREKALAEIKLLEAKMGMD